MKKDKINNRKLINKKLKELDIRIDEYYYLKKILINLKNFLYDFICLYNDIKVKGNMFPYIENKQYKFIYEDEIVKRMKIDKTTISKKLNILTTLGLIEKLNIYETTYEHENIKRAKKKSMKNNNKSVIFFYIPNYTYKVLTEADKRAEKFIKNGYSIRNFSKIMVINIFGQETADNIFLDKRTIPEEYYKQTKEIRNIIIKTLETNEYILFIELKKILHEKFLYNKNTKFKKSAIENNIQIVITELLKDNIIEKRRLNKNEKEIYNISPKDHNYYIIRSEKNNGQYRTRTF